MPFMPAVNLNQWSGALPTWNCFGKVFLDWVFLFCFRRRVFCRFIFWLPQRLLSERELSVGARFKLLSVGAGLQTS